jgi:hypothetical protein
VQNCNGGLVFDADEGVLYIVNFTASGTETSMFRFDATNTSLYFGTYVGGGLADPDIHATDLVTGVITAFTAEQPDGKGPIIVETAFAHRATAYSGSQMIATRNYLSDGTLVKLEAEYPFWE